MLTEISCDRFRRGAVKFTAGLNVVLGDGQASNSIGKSTLLMLVDFAHGGSDFLKESPEVVDNLGNHSYRITFRFDSKEYSFNRSTNRPNEVMAISASNTLDVWPKQKYVDWLKIQYAIPSEYLSFREAVSPFSRIWKRPTLSTEHPLQARDGEAPDKAIERLLKLFSKYEQVKELEDQISDVSKQKKALLEGQKTRLIVSIKKGDFNENQKALKQADLELDRIRQEAAELALNIRSLVNDDVLEAIEQKDELLQLQLQLRSKLQRVRLNLSGVGGPTTRAFEALLEFFPELDVERLVDIQRFHQKLSRILEAELRNEEQSLKEQLELVDEEISVHEQRISEALGQEPTADFLVDRVIRIASDAHKRREANRFYEKKIQLQKQDRELRQIREERRANLLRLIQSSINGNVRENSHQIFAAGRRSPELVLSTNGYKYHVDQDTGTGTSYAAVALLDIAILSLTALPYVVHDSVMLKNIEVPVMAKLIDLYCEVSQIKQVFIAIDEGSKYGDATFRLLREHSAINLSHKELLYDLDWRDD